MKADNEHELLQQWKEGSQEAFGELFSRNASDLYNFAYRLTGQTEDARDILQTAALKAFSRGCPSGEATRFYAWMRRVVLNLFLDSERTNRRAGRPSLVQNVDWEDIEFAAVPQSQLASPRAEMDEHQRMQAIRKALDGLPTEYRAVVVLRDVEGLSYAEIALHLSVGVETVRTRLRRARERLRDTLQPLVSEES
ncbi:MAG TPA: RNA polymerase sigma factor [bacterium]|nr:RNA polymerase sigma factor [bacterium]